jgi:hypothetical protein
MPTGDAVDFAWYRYTADAGSFWAVKVDKLWGDNVNSGLLARNPADPVWPRSANYRLRKVIFQDAVSTRTTSRVLGTTGAAAGVPGFTQVSPVRGASGTYTLTSLGIQPEKRPKQHAIISKPEPITA